jgi:hypothetical protein
METATQNTSEPTQTETNEDSLEAAFNATPPGINPAYAKKEAKAPKEPQEKPESENKTEDVKKPDTEAMKKAEAALKKLKVKGREIEVDETKYHEYAQKGAAATETWQEAAKMKKEIDDFKHRLKTDPRSILTDPNIGIDFKNIAEEFIWEQIQQEQMAEQMKRMSPEEKAYHEARKKAELYDQMRAEQQQKEQQAREAEEESRYEQEFDQKFTKALENSGLPRTTGAVRRMIDYVQADIEAGINRDPAEYADAVYQDYVQDVSELLDPLDGAAILKFLGEKNAKKIRDYDLSRLKKSQPESGYTFVPGKGMQKGDKPQRKLSGKDWEREVMRGFRG